MIKLFITDLDGCIAHPFKSPDWAAVTEIKKLNNQSKSDEGIPALSVCSGRPFPYVEAVSQWLDVEYPVIFESGGGLYNIKTNEITWNPHFDEEAKVAIAELKNWLHNTLIKNYEGTIPEFSKQTDAGLVNPDPSKIALMRDEVLNYVHNNYEYFEVHDTDVSINIILKKANKGEGISFLCDLLDLKLEEVAYIGDSSGDVPALEIVGKSFSPKNAKAEAKEAAAVITQDSTKGVLEAYNYLVEYNRKLA